MAWVQTSLIDYVARAVAAPTPPTPPKRAKGQTKRARVVVSPTPPAPRLSFQAAAHARLTGVEARLICAARALEEGRPCLLVADWVARGMR
mgnify:CR=1 FL=1